ncbi:hypothetical protein [Cysteiniphilum marinum]|uniref:hypothetical protein n=2 Tax=Cysteiniphilum marinum TaxID=2774191 RepID=UPI0019392A0A|nr:hypothetical protein [Cysteiniphilum marinum]
MSNQKLKDKQMYIRGDIHLQLKRYCCDHGITIVEAATFAVTDFLKEKNYLNSDCLLNQKNKVANYDLSNRGEA